MHLYKVIIAKRNKMSFDAINLFQFFSHITKYKQLYERACSYKLLMPSIFKYVEKLH